MWLRSFQTADVRVPQRMQTRYVRLEGEFGSPGVYSVLPGIPPTGGASDGWARRVTEVAKRLGERL